MKKLLILTTIMVVIAFGIGFYVGYNKTQPSPSQNHNNELLEKSTQPKSIEEQPSLEHQNADTLKQALKQEQAKSQALENLVTQQEQRLATLKAKAQNSAPEQEVIPATDYERKAFVTNLVHQFNADNASTEIIDVTCENGFCTLDANVSAGTQTNPEIAKLMKFLDDKQLDQYYQRVSLLNVTKGKDHSSIKFSLN